LLPKTPKPLIKFGEIQISNLIKNGRTNSS